MQLFHCKQLRAKLTARACAANYQAARQATDTYVGLRHNCLECVTGKRNTEENHMESKAVKKAMGETVRVDEYGNVHDADGGCNVHLIPRDAPPELQNPDPLDRHEAEPAPRRMCRNHPDRPVHKNGYRCLECYQQQIRGSAGFKAQQARGQGGGELRLPLHLPQYDDLRDWLMAGAFEQERDPARHVIWLLKQAMRREQGCSGRGFAL